MNLTREFPRSPFDVLAGIVMLPRTLDKCKAFHAGKLGEYHYGCPLDQDLFSFLGTNKDEFAEKVKKLKTDAKITEWVESFNKNQKEKDQFNNKMRHSMPHDEDSRKWMESEKKKLGRKDYFSYFDNIDADEKRF